MKDKSIIINKTAQDTVILYSAIIVNILLGWLITKFNTRYLTLAEYGQYSFFVTMLLYSRSFFSLGMFESTSRLLALEKNKSAKNEYFGSILIIALVVTIPYILFYYIFSSYSDYLFEVKIGRLCYEYAPFVGLAILQAMLFVVLRGSGKIKVLSFLNFSPRLFYLILILILLVTEQFTLSNTTNSLLLGLLIPVILILFILKPSFHRFKEKLMNIYSENKRYGIHLYFGNLMHETFFHADKFLISYYLDSNSMAYYGLAYTLTYPLSHFSNSLANTLFNKFASLQKINKKILYINYLYILVSVFVFIILREPIIRYLFSIEYLPAVLVMFPLALAFGFSGLSKPYSLFLMARGQGKAVRNISTIIPILNITLNILFVPKFGINGAAWAALVSYGLDYILYIYYYQKLVTTQK